MDPKSWGPSAWKFLHAITLTYPENPNHHDQEAAESLFRSLRLLLPCDDCKHHYSELIERTPVATESRRSLSAWLVEIHNRVNTKLGKPQVRFDDVLKTQRRDICTGSCDSSRSTMMSTSTLIIFIFVIVVFVAVLYLMFPMLQSEKRT